MLLQCPSLRGQHDFYNLSIGKFNYVGRSQTFRKRSLWGSGLVHRLREHIFALRGHQLGTIKQKQRRSRYFLMCMEHTHTIPTVMAITSVPDADAPAVEAATISESQPNTNNLQK